MVAPVEYCAVESDFFCIQSIVLSFAIPRSGVEGQSAWTFGGWIFKVLDADLTISLLGQVRAGLTLVEVPPGASLNGRQSGKPTLVLYSRASGIVGFASEFLPEGSPTPTYWLASEVGLGANQWNEQ